MKKILIIIFFISCSQTVPIIVKKKYILPDRLTIHSSNDLNGGYLEYYKNNKSKHHIYIKRKIYFIIDKHNDKAAILNNKAIDFIQKKKMSKAIQLWQKSLKLIKNQCRDIIYYNIALYYDINNNNKALYFYNKAFLCNNRQLYYKYFNRCCNK